MRSTIYILSTFAYFSCVSAHTLVNIKKRIPSIVIDLKYATTENFVHKKVYDFTTCYLLEHVCKALKKVQDELAPLGLGLKVFDGYRPLDAQFTFWKICPDDRYVSNPHIEAGRHTRGTAVDVTLVVLASGKEVEMPTEFDDFTEKAAPDYAGASEQAIKNRALLQKTMNKHGFKNNRTEWWHFDYEGWQEYKPLNIVPANEDKITFAPDRI